MSDLAKTQGPGEERSGAGGRGGRLAQLGDRRPSRGGAPVDGPDDRAKRPAAAAEGRADSVGPERAEGGDSPPALISREG